MSIILDWLAAGCYAGRAPEKNVLLESNLVDNLGLCSHGFDDSKLQLQNFEADKSTKYCPGSVVADGGASCFF